jgi:anti-sigma regulatory factor (Ser/Thr protein kinase)
LGDYFRENNCELTGSLNFKIKSIPYLLRMGLFRVLGFKENFIKINPHEEAGRFIPLTKIKTNDDLNEFMKNIDPILHTSRENSKSIKHVFSEILRNVLEHLNAISGANVCATYNKKRKRISIGVSDAGIGLKNALLESHVVKDGKDAIIKALTPGITGKTKRIGGNDENAGAGLFFTKCIAQSTRNHFLIYSKDCYFKLLTSNKDDNIIFNSDPILDKARIKIDLPLFHGTLVGIDINIDNNAAFNYLIEDIGVAYKNSVKKSEKDYYKRIRFI